MKYFKYVVVCVLMLFVFKCNVYASSVSVKSSSNSIYRGDTVTVTATVSADSGIFTLSGSVYCSGAGVSNGIDLTIKDDYETTNRSISRSIKLTPNASGTIICKSDNVKIRELAKESEYTLDNTSVTITVKNRETTNGKSNGNGGTNEQKTTGGTTADRKEYDSDNTLKSLSVDSYKISPDFNKDTLEYKLEVDETVEKINIKASPNSSKAEIRGVGEKNLTPGDNTIEIKVVAENGNEKVYKLFVTVKDLNPISVTIDGKKYTIVKKNNSILEKPEHYGEDVIKINDQDVVSYVNRNTKVRLVILKDENNQPGYYIYNEHSKKYSLYKAVTIGGVTLQLIDTPNAVKHFKKSVVDIKGEKVTIYKINDSDKVGLIYGTNLKTGNTGYYVYDTEEDTLNRYYDAEVKVVSRELQDLKSKAMIFMGIASAITIVTIMISIISTVKRRKKAINYK